MVVKPIVSVGGADALDGAKSRPRNAVLAAAVATSVGVVLLRVVVCAGRAW